jgi:DsbC/DsbD-like thiol-disulfide interchange protein
MAGVSIIRPPGECVGKPVAESIHSIVEALVADTVSIEIMGLAETLVSHNTCVPGPQMAAVVVPTDQDGWHQQQEDNHSDRETTHTMQEAPKGNRRAFRTHSRDELLKQKNRDR